MKARFDVKQPPVKIIESNDIAYVFICLNEEEKEETVTYTYPVEKTNEDTIEENDYDSAIDSDVDIDDENADKVINEETDTDIDENVEVEPMVLDLDSEVDPLMDDETSTKIDDEVVDETETDVDSELNSDTEVEGDTELEEPIDEPSVEEPEMITTTVNVTYYEYDYNEFTINNDSYVLNDIKEHPENYISYPIILEEEKIKKQEENKKKLEEFLSNSYVEFNGKQYGVSEEDQTEMALNYMQYQISTAASLPATLEWHAKKEACVTFTEEDFLSLTMLIKNFVYPYMNLMQQYKEEIYACTSIDELNAIDLVYKLETTGTDETDESDEVVEDEVDDVTEDVSEIEDESGEVPE